MTSNSPDLPSLQKQVCFCLRNLLTFFPERREETFLHLASWISLPEATFYFILVESEVQPSPILPEL